MFFYITIHLTISFETWKLFAVSLLVAGFQESFQASN
jgi:hypothetical protein